MLNTNFNNGNLSFDYDTDALYYELQVGADTVRKKCSGGKIKKVGIISYSSPNTDGNITLTYDVKANYTNLYAGLTNDNFAYGLSAVWSNNVRIQVSGSYTPVTGIFTITVQKTNGTSTYNAFVWASMFYVD